MLFITGRRSPQRLGSWPLPTSEIMIACSIHLFHRLLGLSGDWPLGSRRIRAREESHYSVDHVGLIIYYAGETNHAYAGRETATAGGLITSGVGVENYQAANARGTHHTEHKKNNTVLGLAQHPIALSIAASLMHTTLGVSSVIWLGHRKV